MEEVKDIQLSHPAGCKTCRTLYQKIRYGLAYCKCNFPEDFQED